MSKKITPCEKLGYKVGDKFEITGGEYAGWGLGSIVELVRDDGTICPEFTGISHKNARYEDNKMFLYVTGDQGIHVTKISKLKPGKQALADAIHKNGGWADGAEYAAQDKCAQVTMFKSKPIRHGNTWLDDEGFDDVGGFGCDKIQNWHQCILSRDEYFTAYPEQVKVVVNNETEPKVEAEMKSESEMTINAGDWHKNGELPPVGEVVTLNGINPNDYYAHHVGAKLTVVAHDNDSSGVGIAVYRFVDADGYNEYHGLVAHAFRPLRTERDKAIDEIISTAKRIGWNSEMASQIIGEVAAELYDAGYRKEVK